MSFTITDLIGYAASFTVLISFLMRDIITLRIVNTIGCALFVAYGVMLNFSIPIVLTNVAIMLINIYYFLKSKKQ